MAMLTWAYPGRNGVSRVTRYIAPLTTANTAAQPTISHHETGARRARRAAARRATPTPNSVQRARALASTYCRCVARRCSASCAVRAAGAGMVTRCAAPTPLGSGLHAEQAADLQEEAVRGAAQAL